MSADTPEKARRDLNHWNAARHGLDCFQASNRRIAQRIARTAGAAPDSPEPDISTLNQ